MPDGGRDEDPPEPPEAPPVPPPPYPPEPLEGQDAGLSPKNSSPCVQSAPLPAGVKENKTTSLEVKNILEMWKSGFICRYDMYKKCGFELLVYSILSYNPPSRRTADPRYAVSIEGLQSSGKASRSFQGTVYGDMCLAKAAALKFQTVAASLISDFNVKKGKDQCTSTHTCNSNHVPAF